MQDAGVLATLQSLWVDSRVRNPSLTIESRVLLDERDIPDGLKPVVLRIARMTLDFAEQTPSPCCVAWVLERDGRILSCPSMSRSRIRCRPNSVRCQCGHQR